MMAATSILVEWMATLNKCAGVSLAPKSGNPQHDLAEDHSEADDEGNK